MLCSVVGCGKKKLFCFLSTNSSRQQAADAGRRAQDARCSSRSNTQAEARRNTQQKHNRSTAHSGTQQHAAASSREHQQHAEAARTTQHTAGAPSTIFRTVAPSPCLSSSLCLWAHTSMVWFEISHVSKKKKKPRAAHDSHHRCFSVRTKARFSSKPPQFETKPLRFESKPLRFEKKTLARGEKESSDAQFEKRTPPKVFFKPIKKKMQPFNRRQWCVRQLHGTLFVCVHSRIASPPLSSAIPL